jgi:hypothetical protein
VIILVAGLGFGRQVLHWWAADKPRAKTASSPPSAGDALGDPSQPHVLQFGDQPWSLRRQSISGDRAAATAALLADCRRALQSVRSTPAGGPGDHAPAAGTADATFLDALKSLKAAEEEPGKWRLYDLPNSFPMVVGVRVGKGDSPNFAGRKSGQSPGRRKWGQSPDHPAAGRAEAQLAETTSGVVIWGLAIPLSPKAWTLYTFQPDSDTGQPDSSLANIPIPPGGRRIVAMQVADGGAITAFSGPDQTQQWKGFYDGWFGQHGWKTVKSWRQTGASWNACYIVSDPRQPAVADVQLSPDGQGRCTGLLMTSRGSF